MRLLAFVPSALLLLAALLTASPALAHHEADPCYPGESAGESCSYINGCPDGSRPTHDAEGWHCPDWAPTCSDGSPAERMPNGDHRCSYPNSGGASEDAYVGDEPPPVECPDGHTWTRFPDRTWGCFDECPPGSTRATDAKGREYCIAPASMGSPGAGEGQQHSGDAPPPGDCSEGHMWMRAPDGSWGCIDRDDCRAGSTDPSGRSYCTARADPQSSSPAPGAQYTGDTPPPADCPNGVGWSRLPDGTWGCFDECPPGWTESADAQGRKTCIAPQGAGMPGAPPTTSDGGAGASGAASGAKQDAATSNASDDAGAAAKTPGLGVPALVGGVAVLALMRRRA